jgi:peptidoglycan/xylan/chitin deacetylase (PgdA/CDA1 family)
MYHQIMADPPAVYRKYTLSPRQFAAHMAWLSVAGYRPIGLDDILDYVQSRRRLPSRSVAITFDDGYAAAVSLAVPILRRRRFKAMFYLVGGLMGRTAEWLTPRLGLDLPLIDWHTARMLQEIGFECGSHSMSHRHLTHLPDGEVRHELTDSRRLLKERLGQEIAHVAYPWGAVDSRVRRLACEAGYMTGCSVRIGTATASDDLLLLPRVPITGFDTIIDFIVRLRTAGTARDLVHDWLAAVPRARRRSPKQTQ